MELLYFSWPEYNTWREGAFAAVCVVTKRRNFRASHARLRNISIFFSEEVAKFPIWMIISLWSHSAWTWLADFRHLAARENACAISYTFATMIPELFLNTGYQHSHAFQFDQLLLFLWSGVLFSSNIRWMFSCPCNFTHLSLGENKIPRYSCLAHSWVSLVCQRQDICKLLFHNSVVGILV